MDPATLYMLLVCPGYICPEFDRDAAASFTLSRTACVEEMQEAHRENKRAYCVLKGGGEIIQDDGTSRYQTVISP